MPKNLKVFCPKCGYELQEFGPLRNDYEGPSIKTIKMKCDGCSPHGSIWQVIIKDDLVTEIKFARSLFRDHDHR